MLHVPPAVPFVERILDHAHRARGRLHPEEQDAVVLPLDTARYCQHQHGPGGAAARVLSVQGVRPTIVVAA